MQLLGLFTQITPTQVYFPDLKKLFQSKYHLVSGIYDSVIELAHESSQRKKVEMRSQV